jgi:signal transduction histidine kinase
MGRLVGRLLASVRVRVTATAVLAVACALGAAAFFLEGSLQHDRQRILMSTAQQQALEVVNFNPQMTLPLVLPTDYFTLQSGLVQVLKGGKLLGQSHILAAEKLPPLWLPGDPQVQQNSYVFAGQAQDVHVVAVPVTTATKVKATVVVVTSLDQYDSSLADVRKILELGLPILLAVVGIICWAIVGRALRPIEALRREVTDIATTPGSLRIAEPGTDDEVGRLARTLNSMLDRIEAASARERRFVSDASHELRSPIANIRTEIEVALHHPEFADWPTVAEDVLTENDRMGRLVQELLLLARADEGSLLPTSGATDLGEVAEQADTGITESGPQVFVNTVFAPVAVPPIYLERIVANLVGNARRFAASRIDVTVSREGSYAVLRVRDDGPGVPKAERNRIFERFVRLDEARDRGDGGFGLGLAIVADLCRAYGGHIEVGDAAPGAVFTVHFPLVQGVRPRRRLRHPVRA